MKNRTWLQVLILVLFFIVPLFDIFRIDMVHLHFYVLGRKFSFDDGYILLLTVLVLVFTFVSISKWFGRQFCGWMCPHNTFSGYLTKLTNSKALKNNATLRNTIDIGLSVIFAPVIGFSMIAYFYNPQDLLAEIIHFDTSAWSFWAYFITTVFFFLMINRLRHKFCRNACPYGMLQMILSDKNSRQGGFRNMFRGAGFVLTILMTVMISLLLVAIFNSTGFAVSIAKNIQGIPAQNKIIYTYNLEIENLEKQPMAYTLEYKNIPQTWDSPQVKTVTVPANSVSTQSLIFRIDQGSVGINTNVTVIVKNEKGKTIERELNIFPIRK
ncbi:4Fe-4S binding protein [Aneurinibacillus terranovensis]|uniref:4Fe-4S binding protein n=1 Tax=Aneurinibacillus terranovensis TaxID=278991 RepID=UPI00041D84D9|nr:4Fe-4S binding protein [Aneurinibacillus terranovensis]